MKRDNYRHLDLDKLTQVFRDAGANDPEGWARSQIQEGINQLGRFSFLKAVTSEWLKDGDIDWVDNQINFDYSKPGSNESKLPNALKEMVNKNVSRKVIVDLVRAIQFETLFHVCATIDKVYEPDTPVSSWNLFETDENYAPIPMSEIDGLHESLYEFDPSPK